MTIDAAASPAARPRSLGVHAISPERVRANAKLVVAYGGVSDGGGRAPDRDALFESLNRIQPWRFAWQSEPPEPILTFGDEPFFHHDTLAHLMLEDELPDGWQYPEEERAALRHGVAMGRAILADVAPGTLGGIDHLIGEFVCGRRSVKSGGSLSDVIGVIWLGPKEPWNDARYAEALAHEYTHHALFLEDMTRGIFSRPVSEMDTDGLVRSALLQRPRGYDKSFHSALVSLVIIQLHEARGARPEEYRPLAPPLRVTLAELDAKDAFLSPNGRRVLDDMHALLDRVEGAGS